MERDSSGKTCSACGVALTATNQSAALVKYRRKLCTACDARRKGAYAHRYAEKRNLAQREIRKAKAQLRGKLTDLARFEKFFTPSSVEGDCWPWIGAVNKETGYGAFRLGGKVVSAHRAMLSLCAAIDLSGVLVRHKCDNRLCVNPSHLETGTQQDNMQDAVDRGRICHGAPRVSATLGAERVALRKLTDSQVLQIVAQVRQGSSRSELAAKFEVTRDNIDKIMLGDTWSHLTGIPCRRHTWEATHLTEDTPK